MRRFLLLLLVAALLPVHALCETGAERLATLDIISQRDPRLTDEKYFYMGMLFRIGGCKPSSVTNTLTALLATPDTDVPKLLTELRKGLTYQEDASIEMFRLETCLNKPRESATELRKMLQQVTSIHFVDAATDDVTPSQLIRKYAPTEDVHPLIIREMTVDKNWSWLLEMAGELCAQGHPDARFALSTASAGTDESDGPFRSGTSGHFITIYFQAEEFHKEGTFYLLDSLPRAMEGDIYGYFEHYPSRYPFLVDKHRAFGKTYDATRIIDTVLQFKLNEAERARLDSIAPSNSEARTAVRLEQIKALILYGRAHFMLYIP